MIRNTDGAALLLVLLVTLVIGSVGMSALVIVGNSSLITAYEERQSLLETVAEASLEEARAVLNGTAGLYPDSGFVTLANGAPAVDAEGNPIPGVRRFVYAGPVGVATGQFGVIGSVVAIAEAPNGDRVVRRRNIGQESFAKFAYFTDIEPANIAFGAGDRIQGPVHTNDFLKIYPSGATFTGPGMATTARTVQGTQYGVFQEGYQEEVARIEMPPAAELDRLHTYAQQGGTAFVAPTGGNPDGARIRIEFLRIGEHGFFRVFRSQNQDRLMAAIPGAFNGWPSSTNCGIHGGPAGSELRIDDFNVVADTTGNNAAKRAMLSTPRSRCYLGGHEALNRPAGTFVANPDGVAGMGWVARPFPLAGNGGAIVAARADRDYLFPLDREFNPEFRGVIHVTGRVAISGVVRGQLTLAATSHVFLVDDLVYASQPGGNGCRDMLGIFSQTDVIVADNAINSPVQLQSGGAWFSLGSTTHETIHGVILALNQFYVQNFNTGATAAQPCDGEAAGRGCLYTAGGIIQRERGAVGLVSGQGYRKRYSYDSCAFTDPPPYFPTTGRFSAAQFFEVDPVGFDVAAFFERGI